MRSTHVLEIAERGTCQDMERNRLSKGHSLSGDHRVRDLSGHGKELPKQDALTSWRPQKRGFQNMERNRPGKRYSHPGDRGERDLSGHGKKATEQLGALTN